MLQYVADNASQFQTEYGNVSAASVGAIQRGLLQIDEQGGDRFFGEPMLNIQDFMQPERGKGVVNILTADKLMNAPQLYADLPAVDAVRAVRAVARGGRDLDKAGSWCSSTRRTCCSRTRRRRWCSDKIELVVRLVRSRAWASIS